jgi:cyclopropane-fatty-acyl-phospholipid synthase
LSSQIELLQQDYRDLVGSFDKLVSIEMIEAVGHRYFDAFFRKCSELLRADGSMVLQAIVISDRRYKTHLRSVDFMQRFVFPGGCLPSVGAMFASINRQTDFRLTHLEDYGPHYAETLRRWKRAFHAHRDEVLRLGFTEQFIRLWNYYLCYCEAAFEERQIGLVQMQFDKPECRRTEIPSEVRKPNYLAYPTPHSVGIEENR